MKRYFVFNFTSHYPIGGMSDFIGAADTLEEARKITGSGEITEIWDMDELRLIVD